MNGRIVGLASTGAGLLIAGVAAGWWHARHEWEALIFSALGAGWAVASGYQLVHRWAEMKPVVGAAVPAEALHDAPPEPAAFVAPPED